ncbi:DUF882 domain-containing protein [Rhizobium sp. SSA_523]|uniref:DUF882 domain-containing protein n=1 Tax=Rhizobium sp. SSA_523 TaxID=2952477 RepID=UPI00209047BB|nr:DUF882 domain-containing protein [Rhizobium sp. SSA_523]MCO5731943.1 DUF882 domain-containing protein [Rhizobium sp. SSA_523]WKC25704.1 DUF882 domain-containing protein [Rhizobium sp. SSA_523]
MTGLGRRVTAAFASLAIIASLAAPAASPALAAGETRSLKVYFVHTGEKAVITFKRNGRYDQQGLQALNRFLRDWRRNEPTRMDPRLFDLVWEVYRRVGGSDYIHVVSAYRSPNTNGMLRSRTKGVAKNSQHMLGKAMDFFIPGVKLAKLRETAMLMQVGGVGFYPTSGSPFVHLDVGSVRAWPRMSRQELVRLFPNGNTMHLPSDGKPLPGYEQAVADYKRRVGANTIQVASTAGRGPSGSSGSERKSNNLFAMLFGNNGDEDEDADAIAAPETVPDRPSVPARPVAREPEPEEAPVMVAEAAPVRPDLVAVPETGAPVPLSRPAFREDPAAAGLTALYSQPQNTAQQAIAAVMPATPTARPEIPLEAAVDLASLTVPVPTLLGPRGLKGDAGMSGLETASLAPALAPADGGALMAAVPVPGHRPDLGSNAANPAGPAPVGPQTVALAAPAASAAPAGPVGQSVTSDDEKQALTPELLAELARSAGYTPTAAPQPGGEAAPATASAPAAIAAPGKPPRPAARPAQQQLALADPSASGTAGMVFNDGFDMPKPSASAPAAASTAKPTTAKAPAKVVKGGAVSRLGGRPATPGPNVLTGDTLAQWALANKQPDRSASTKAPRMVVRALSADVSAGYSGGFKPVSQAIAIDPNRFSDRNLPKP